MKFKQVLAAVIVPLAVALAVAGCSGDDSSKGSDTTGTTEATTTTAAPAAMTGTPMGSPPAAGTDTKDLNIVQIAAGTGDVSTLTRLVLLAGLAPTLAGEGPFTVFAPPNAAFDAVDPATLMTVKEDRDTLTTVLTLHVVPGLYTTEDLKAAAGTSLTTAAGGTLLVEVDADGNLIVGGAKVIGDEIPASNGIIHLVESVITAPNGA